MEMCSRSLLALCCSKLQEQSHHGGGDETYHVLILQVHSAPPLRSCQTLSKHFEELCSNQTLVLSFFSCLSAVVCWSQCNLKQESPTLRPNWTTTCSNGLESCCACKTSPKCLQKLQPSPVLGDVGYRKVQCSWILCNKSLSSSVWGKDVHWAAVGVAELYSLFLSVSW